MKTVTALLTAAATLAFAGSAMAACPWSSASKPAPDQSAEITPESPTAGS